MFYEIRALERWTHLSNRERQPWDASPFRSVGTQVLHIAVLFQPETPKQQWALFPRGHSWWNARECGDLGGPFVASAVLLVAERYWISMSAHSRGRTGEQNWIIHWDRPARWEAQHKWMAKRMTGALAIPSPRIHGYPDANSQHCPCFQVRETLPLCFLLGRGNGDFWNRNHVRFFTCHVNVNNSVYLSEPWSSHQ